MTDILRPIPLSDCPVWAADALRWWHQGLSPEALAIESTTPLLRYLFHTDFDNPELFKMVEFDGFFRTWVGPMVGLRLQEFPDQNYFRRYVYPHYSETQTTQRPTAHLVRTKVGDRYSQYRRLLLPLRERSGRNEILTLTFVDYAVALDDAKPAELSRRERQCLFLLSNGATSKEIAAYLHLSRRTVEEHIDRAKIKLGANNVTHATTIALIQDLIEANDPSFSETSNSVGNPP